MGSGFRTFAAGEVLTSANVQNYLMDQAVMSFATAAARNAAITVPEEGMLAYTQDTDIYWSYTNAAWVELAYGGAWTVYTPAWTTTATAPVIGNGSIVGHYMRQGKTITVAAEVVSGTTTTYGTGSYRISLPVTASLVPEQFLQCRFFNTANAFAGQATLSVGTYAALNAPDAGGLGRLAAVTNTAPFTPGASTAGNTWRVNGTYEAA